MYVVTGGAGFIGSHIVAGLVDRNEDVVVSDWFGVDQRWRNIAKHDFVEIIAPEDLLPWLDLHRGAIDAVIHMGAISATTETNVDLIVARNIRPSVELLTWCTDAKVRFIYASSAATYGNGANGFDDSFDREALARLRPLSPYGWSKHFVDRRIARLEARADPLPPQWVGLKFFNVYGPNEYHKGSMQSVIAKNFADVAEGKPLRLFRSDLPEYPDGGQLRDFIYVEDCVDVILWLLDHDHVSGLFNVGTGKARSWLDLAAALFEAAGRPRRVEFVDMPQAVRGSYQYFTEARMDRLRAAGYSRPFTSLEQGVSTYVRNFLATHDAYR